MLPDNIFAFLCGFSVILTMLPAANMWANAGWPWRKEVLISDQQMVRYRNERLDIIQIGCTIEQFIAGGNSRNSDGSPKCRLQAPTQVIVLGDSHVVDGYNSLYSQYAFDPQVNIIFTEEDGGKNLCGFEFTDKRFISNIQSDSCLERANTLNNLDWEQIDIVALDVFENQERHFNNINALLSSFPHLRAIVLGSYIGIRPYFCSELVNRFKSFEVCKDPRYVSHFRRDEDLDVLLPKGQFLFVDTIRLFCGEAKRLADCPVSLGDGLPVF